MKMFNLKLSYLQILKDCQRIFINLYTPNTPLDASFLNYSLNYIGMMIKIAYLNKIYDKIIYLLLREENLLLADIKLDIEPL